MDNPNIPGNIGYTRHMTKTNTNTHTKIATLNTKKMQKGFDDTYTEEVPSIP